MRKKTTLLKRILFLTALFGTGEFAFAQGEANIWYFGTNAGVDFNGGAPVAITNNQLDIFEGCASICNAAGNLLFYTDGMTVYNRNHVVMANGTGLMGQYSTTQVLIIQKPGSATIYYIFTAGVQAGANGIRYSEVDMTLSGGLGSITANKNILLNTPSCEKITGIRHCNNKDIWVVTHDWNSNGFRTYLVTSAGVNTTPVLSNAGSVINQNLINTQGYLKGSPDGRKLAAGTCGAWGTIDNFELFDFNNSTGIVSNPILFPNPNLGGSKCYGVEFSPDGTKLYGSLSTLKIYQFDLCAGSNTAIANSGVLIATSGSAQTGALQLGPNNKIYFARYNAPWLGVINNPNALGAACNYVDNGVSLAGRVGQFGLPNFVNYYFKEPLPPFTASINCLNGTFATPTVNISNCSGSTNAITSVSWNFGDPASGSSNTSTSNNPSHTFSGAGTYTVTLVLNTPCSDTLRQTVTAVICGFTTSATSTSISCAGQCTGTASATVSAGTGPYTYSWNTTPIETSQQVTGLCQGDYTVTATDALGATSTATVSIIEPTLLSATTTFTAASCGGNNGSATVTASGGTTGYTYSWNATPVQTTQTATGLGAGNYTATVTDANGCTQTQTVAITSSGTFSVSTSSTQAGCTVNNGTATATANSGTSPFTYNWNNGQATQTATGLAAGNYTVTVTDANGCIGTQTTTVTFSNTLLVSASSTQAGCTVNNGTATATGSSGTTPYSYLWNNGQATQTATGLAAGNYTVTVTDAAGCTGTQTTTVTFSNTLLVSTSSTQTGCTINNGTATATGSSGTTPYSYLWNNGQATQTATGLATGNYTATVTDAAGCTGTQTVNVTQTTGPAAAATASPTGILPGNSTTLSATGGTTYQWSPANNLSCISCQNPVATPTANTIYCVTVTDANNCTDTDCVTISILTEPVDCGTAEELYLPNAFSPNADGENDYLKIYYVPACIKTFLLTIYDRWGEKVYETTNPSFAWDGTYKDKPQTTAVFVYSMEAEFLNGEQITRKGNISLIK